MRHMRSVCEFQMFPPKLGNSPGPKCTSCMKSKVEGDLMKGTMR